LVALAGGTEDASASEAVAPDTSASESVPEVRPASDADASSGGDADEPMPRDDAPEVDEQDETEEDA
jgi:hypothetical protein